MNNKKVKYALIAYASVTKSRGGKISAKERVDSPSTLSFCRGWMFCCEGRNGSKIVEFRVFHRDAILFNIITIKFPT